MSQERLENDEFLSRLTALLATQSTKSSGSLYITQKPLPPPPTTSTSTSSSEAKETPSSAILIRLSNGTSSRDNRAGKIKLATIVQADEIDAFFGKFSDVCKSGMDGLRKRDRKKDRAKRKAAKGTATGKK